jgi:predicted nucleic acid-binding Zn ribbon protein
MSEVNCLYCGKAIPDDVAECPHCGAVSHFQQLGYRHGARRRFFWFVVAVALFCLVVALWAPVR